jgi:hypothetical protein
MYVNPACPNENAPQHKYQSVDPAMILSSPVQVCGSTVALNGVVGIFTIGMSPGKTKMHRWFQISTNC